MSTKTRLYLYVLTLLFYALSATQLAAQTYQANPNCTFTIPIALQILRNDGGTGGISDAQARAALANINSAFSGTGIQFSEHSISYHNSSELLNMTEYEFYSVLPLAWLVTGAFNLYFAATYTTGNNAEGGASQPMMFRMVIQNQDYLSTVPVHETGHLLGLYHTHGESVHNEHVARTGPDANCLTEGDGLCDTPAEPWNGGLGLHGLVDANCNYNGNLQDELYQPYTPNTHNYMSYSLYGCKNQFTAGQIQRMRNNIVSPGDLRIMAGIESDAIHFVADNKINGVSAGGTINIAGYSRTTPHEADYPGCILLTEWPENERLPETDNPPGLQGVLASTYKHRDWNDKLVDYKLYREAPLPLESSSSLYETADFHKMNELTFNVHFADGETDADFEFLDPWHLADDYHNQPNAFTSATNSITPYGKYNVQSGGIFNGMELNPLYSTFPYYSMRIPQTMDWNTKQPITRALIAGDWVCYGMFADVANGSTCKEDIWHQATNKLTNAVTLNAGAGTVSEITAEFTGHRSSIGAVPPTRTNSQRKVAVQHTGTRGLGIVDVHHAVYESDGKIFYTRSTDAGITWLPEMLVSDFWKTSARPCIATSSHGWDPDGDERFDHPLLNIVYVSYVEDNSVVVKYLDWYADTYTPDINRWIEIDRMTTSVAGICTPAIAAGQPTNGSVGQYDTTNCVVVWEDNMSLKYSIYVNFEPFVSNPGGTPVVHRNLTLKSGRYWSGLQIQPRYPSLRAYPTMSTQFQNYSESFSVAWNEQGALFHKDLEFGYHGWNSGFNSASLYDYERVAVTHGQQILNSAAPTLSYNMYQTLIGYEYGASQTLSPPRFAYPSFTRIVSSPLLLGGLSYYPVTAPYPSTGTGPVASIKRVSLRTAQLIRDDQGVFLPRNWSATPVSIVKTTTSASMSPSLTSNESYQNRSNGQAKVATNDANSSHCIVQVQSWPSRIYFYPGLDGFDPNINTAGGDLLRVYSNFAYTPFDFKVSSSSLYLGKTTENESVVMKEVFIGNADSGWAMYGVVMPHIVNSDSVRTEIAWAEFDDSLAYAGQIPFEQLTTTEFFNVPAGGYLEYGVEMFAQYVSEDIQNANIELKFYEELGAEPVHVVTISVGGLPRDSAMYLLHRVELGEFADRSLCMTIGLSDTTEGLIHEVEHVFWVEAPELDKSTNERINVPASITLSNFPNPFNPSTEITYGIPEETHVKLAVFDQLGREVKVLANGWKAAGTYTVTFDAAELPSGMYLYRIETGKGTVSKKMVLMK